MVIVRKGNKLLKVKVRYLFWGFFLIFIMGYFIKTANFLKIETYTDQFWKQLDEIKLYDMPQDEIQKYEDKITQELSQMKNRYSLQKAYFALGYMEGMKENYEESNNLYFQSISINSKSSANFLGQVYGELAVNYLALNQVEEAENYFQMATNLINSDNLKLRVYQRYAQGILLFTDQYYRAIELLEVVDTLSKTDDQEIENQILFSDLYVMFGEYDEAIAVLTHGLELSREIQCVNKERELTLKLGSFYYLMEDYKQVIELLKEYVFILEPNRSMYYLEPFVNSIHYTQGYEAAMLFLEEYEREMIHFKEENKWLPQLYVVILKAEAALKDGNLILGQNYLNEADLLNEKVRDIELGWWIEKLYLERLVLEGMHGEKIILKYTELYHLIENSNLFYFIKFDLLNEILSINMKLGYYALAYDVLADKRKRFYDFEENVEAVNLEEIYDETKLEFKEARIQAIGDIGIIILSLGASIGAVARFIYMKQEEINSLEHDKDREGLTKTLTKKSLYQRLQAYIGQGNEFTFIVLQYDHFKRYNEVYGYLSGDEALKTLANCIKEIFENEYISRHLGNQFIIVSYHSKEACVPNLMHLMQTIYDLNIENSTDLKDRRLTISAGISSGILDSEEAIDQQIKLATNNLEKSRQRGNNKFTTSSI